MRAIITGAAGFLGSHLVDRFLAEGHRVVGVDNFLTGSNQNILTAHSNRLFQFVEADVASPWDWARSIEAPDLIMHFASPASPVDYGRKPLETMLVNAMGAVHGIDLARSAGARLLLASTSEAYGDPLEHPQRETYWGNVNPTGPRACYDESKRFAEAYVSSAVRKDGVNGRIVRIFNTYGPRMSLDDGRVIPNFCSAVMLGKPLPIYGDGMQTRSFCYVDDLVEGIVRFATTDGLDGRVINIGNPTECTVRELVTILSDVAGVPLRVVHHELPPDDPARRRPDITLARALLDWEPSVNLWHGLSMTLQGFRDAQAGSSNGIDPTGKLGI